MSSSPLPSGSLTSLLSRNVDFRRLFFATVVSFTGDWFAFVAVSGFVSEATQDPAAAAWVYAASVLPTFFLAPVAGVVADRVDRKWLMATMDLLRIPPALALCLALLWGSPALAYVSVILLAAFASFVEPIAAAAVPNVVPPEDLPLAQGALAAVWGSMLFVGAALGGMVSVLFGRQTSFVLNAVTFLVSAILILRIRRPLQEGFAAKAGFFTHLFEVFALARKRFVIRALLVTKTGVGLSNGIVGLLPTFASVRFDAGDKGVGLLLAMRGLGALAGSFWAQKLVRGDGRRLFFLCGLSMLTYGLAYALLPFAPSLGLAAACVVLAHLGGGAQWSLSTYGLQVTTPDVIRGRVLSLDFGVATLAIGLSSLGAGVGARRVGIEWASWGLSLAALVYGALWLMWTRRAWLGKRDPLQVTE